MAGTARITWAVSAISVQLFKLHKLYLLSLQNDQLLLLHPSWPKETHCHHIAHYLSSKCTLCITSLSDTIVHSHSLDNTPLVIDLHSSLVGSVLVAPRHRVKKSKAVLVKCGATITWAPEGLLWSAITHGNFQNGLWFCKMTKKKKINWTGVRFCILIPIGMIRTGPYLNGWWKTLCINVGGMHLTK